MTAAPPRSSTVDAGERTDLLTLHLCRTQPDLEQELARHLQTALPAQPFVVALHASGHRRPRVQVLGGTSSDDPVGREARDTRVGQPLDETDLRDWQRLPVTYLEHELGVLCTPGPVEAATAASLERLLRHFGAALANMTFGAEARAASAHYCASLQALEEGIVLFQESDHDAVIARLLSLVTAMVQAPAGALFVLETAGDSSSPLVLQQTLGMPMSLVEQLRGTSAEPWAGVFLRRNTFHADRAEDPSLGGLHPDSVPAVVRSLVSVPLRYQGVDTGLCVLFNVPSIGSELRDRTERLTSFGRLAAAVLHRLHLEAMTAHQRSIQKELQIAAAIQERLLPTRAPKIDRLQFAWHSLSANNIGGDYLDLVPSDLGDLHAIIADASGHGINSALLMSSFRSTYRAEAPWMEPAALCCQLNAEVGHEVGQTGMFITAAALRIERTTLRMTITSAGHNPLLLYRAAEDRVVVIEAHGPPLGFSESAEFGAERHQLAAGDVLLLYTDGITEACNQDLDMFGEERLIEVLRRGATWAPDRLLQEVLAALAAFTNRNRYDDDVSLSIIKVLPA